MPTDVGDFEPIKATKRAGRAPYSHADGVVDPLVGRADNLREPVHVATHQVLLGLWGLPIIEAMV
jgi:hypothetical protein